MSFAQGGAHLEHSVRLLAIQRRMMPILPVRRMG